MTLEQLGWDAVFAQRIPEKDYDLVARVCSEYKKTYNVLSDQGEFKAFTRGKLFYQAKSQNRPVVGDWILAQKTIADSVIITHVLPRKSKFSRKIRGHRLEEQVIAANIDYIFIVAGLDDEFNIRRLERYILLCQTSGASPVVLLNKMDICKELQKRKKQTEDLLKVPVYSISALKNQGLENIQKLLKEGTTGALLGSSGVGKSTIINQLLKKNVQKTADLRKKMSAGKHTTTRRQLFLLPFGGLLIDTPGMRELQLWQDEEAIEQMFTDILELAGQCRFKNCSHRREPGCAVQQAIQQKRLSRQRLDHYFKLKQEIKEIQKSIHWHSKPRQIRR